MQNTVKTDQAVVNEVERTKFKRGLATIAKDWRLYVLLIPMLAFLICFKYLPIAGILEGFKWGSYQQSTEYMSQWCGTYWLEYIFVGDGRLDFWRAFRNTFVNSMYGLIIGFPIPIFLALLFSEVKILGLRSVFQVCSYLPHFISTVVVTTIITLWCTGENSNAASGVIYNILKWCNLLTDKRGILAHPRYFRPIYQISGIWEGAGYGSIVYFAAILAISPTSYEAARIDGASKMQQIRYVTIPGMAPTLTIMLIMRIGHILNIGYEKIILLIGSTQSAWETGDVVSTLVYRMTGRGGATGDNVQVIEQMGVVADLFNSIIAMVLVLGANAISRRVSSTSLF